MRMYSSNIYVHISVECTPKPVLRKHTLYCMLNNRFGFFIQHLSSGDTLYATGISTMTEIFFPLTPGPIMKGNFGTLT